MPLTRRRLKEIAALARTKGRREHGRFLVEGARSVTAALDARAPLDLVLVADGHAEIVRRAEDAGVPVETVAGRDLDRAGDARTSQGVLAVARSVVSDRAADVEPPALVLDGVQDPGNVGALVRTAAWFGAQSVVANDQTADFESPKAVRASMGGVWDVRLVRVPSLVPALGRLASSGAEVWGADLGGDPVGTWRPDRRAALVLGSEAHGLSEPVRSWLRANRPAGSRFVFIPGAERAGPRGVESLNVAVSAGVLLARWLG